MLAAVRTNRDLLIPLLGHHFGYSPQVISIVFAVSAVVEIALVVPPARSCSATVGWRCCCPVCSVPASPSLSLTVGRFDRRVRPRRCRAGRGNGLGAGINKTLSADLTPSHNRAAWMGWWNAMVGAGALIGPGLVAVC